MCPGMLSLSAKPLSHPLESRCPRGFGIFRAHARGIPECFFGRSKGVLGGQQHLARSPYDDKQTKAKTEVIEILKDLSHQMRMLLCRAWPDLSPQMLMWFCRACQDRHCFYAVVPE